MIPKVLSIAGVDPSGGAGVLADVKSFSALRAYGMGIIAALTAQSTQGVTGFVAVEPEFVRQQWDTLVADILPDAIKLGMLANTAVATEVAAILDDYGSRAGAEAHIVLDPVMVATSGDRLLDPDTEGAIKALVPRASIITPNLPEAAVLLGREPITEAAQMPDVAHALLDLGAQRVLLKAGHLTGEQSVDLYADELGIIELPARRVGTRNTHGTGCSLSSAIAALRPQVEDWSTACAQAKSWLTGGLRHADELEVGQGHGPVHHFWNLWPQAADTTPEEEQ